MEGERRAHCRGAQACYGAIEPARGCEPPDLSTHEENHAEVCEGIEGQVQGVSHGGSGRAPTPEGLDRERYVAERPREQCEAQYERSRAVCPADEAPDNVERAGDELHGTDRPPVEPGPGFAISTSDQR